MALYDSTSGSVGAFDAYHKHQVIIGNLAIPLMFRFTQNPNNLTFSMEKEYRQTKTIGGYVYEHWGKKPTIMRGEVLIKKEGSIAQVFGVNTKTTGFDLEDKTFSPELFTLQTLFDVDQRKIAYRTGDLLGQAGKIAGGITMGVLSGGATTVATAVSGIASLISKSGSGKDAAYQKLVDDNVYTEPGQATLSGYLNTFTDTFIYYKGCIYTGFFTKMQWKEDGSEPFVNRVTFEFLVTGTTYDWIETMLVTTGAGRIVSGAWGLTSTVTTLGSLLKDIFKTVSSIF